MKLLELLLNFIKKPYIWATLVIIFLVLIGWTTVSEVKEIGQQILDKIGTIDVDL